MTVALQRLFTTAEIRRLIAKLILAAQNCPTFTWLWSQWRQAHQAFAALCHRKKHLKRQL